MQGGTARQCCCYRTGAVRVSENTLLLGSSVSENGKAGSLVSGTLLLKPSENSP